MHDDSAFRPDWAATPAESIRRALVRRGWSEVELAEAMDVPEQVAKSLVDGVVPIDGQHAVRLASALGTSADFWEKRQSQYTMGVKRVDVGSTARAWLRELPLRDMAKFGWIEAANNDADRLTAALAFFGVGSVDEWQRRYRSDLAAAAFRTSLTFTSNPIAITAWLRRAEIQASIIACKPWNADSFRTALLRMRALTRRKHPDQFLPELIRLAAECGVAVVIARAPDGCKASGATRFISATKAMIVMSFRYRSDDHFWFTFFHEAAHLLLHGQKALFLEDGSEVTIDEESEANDFASEVLIPKNAEAAFLKLGPSAQDVIRFAVRIGISPGIVVGQLQHRGRIERNRLNRLKRRYTWSSSPTDMPTLGKQ